MLNTSGDAQNSYITLSEANALLLTMAASFMMVGDQLEEEDEAYLIEAARDLDTLWKWKGEPAEQSQALAWPRKEVPKPGFQVPAEPGWNTPYDPYEFLEYKINFLSGSQAIPYLADDEVPLLIREAQALIALLRKSGGNLVEDTQGGMLGTKLGPVEIRYVNAIRESADIHKRTGQFGRFLPGLLGGA